MQDGPNQAPNTEDATPQAQATPTPASNWQFTGKDQDTLGDETTYAPHSFDPISWTASEYIDHEKNRSWFLAIGGGTVLVAAVTFLLTRDIISVTVIIFAGLLLGISATRKPRTLSFQLNDDGLQVGQKMYPYGNFKSFTVVDEGAISSIQLMPARRFMPSLSVYYPPDIEEAIISNLGNILPHEEHKRDAVDSFMRRIKF